MLYNKLPTYIDKNPYNAKSHAAKQYMARKCINYFWPDYNVIWINSVEIYDNIEKIINSFSQKKDIIILQTEEDFLKQYDLVSLRNRIKNIKNWTDNSFIITNCYKDYLVTKEILNVKFKPGILDLICYQPYTLSEKEFTNYNDIKYHSAFVYNRKDLARNAIQQLLLEHKKKTSAIVYNNKLYWSQLEEKNSIIINKTEPIDPPFLQIQNDYPWSRSSAFHLVIEPFNNITLEKMCEYTPILSEKTYKAIHHCRPALIYSGPGTRDYLQKLGFDTWDWLIDWSFDKEQDRKKGFILFLNELKRLLNLDINSIKNKIELNKLSLNKNRNQLFFLINNYAS